MVRPRTSPSRSATTSGNFVLTGVPAGTHQIVVFDQWLDQIIEYSTVTVPDNQVLSSTYTTCRSFSWFTNIGLNAFVDLDGNGVQGATLSRALRRYR